jgi:hypothetical protein
MNFESKNLLGSEGISLSLVCTASIATTSVVATMVLVDCAVTKSLCPVEVLGLLLNGEDRLRDASSACCAAESLGGLGPSPVQPIASTASPKHLAIGYRGSDASDLVLLFLVRFQLLLTELLQY